METHLVGTRFLRTTSAGIWFPGTQLQELGDRKSVAWTQFVETLCKFIFEGRSATQAPLLPR